MRCRRLLLRPGGRRLHPAAPEGGLRRRGAGALLRRRRQPVPPRRPVQRRQVQRVRLGFSAARELYALNPKSWRACHDRIARAFRESGSVSGALRPGALVPGFCRAAQPSKNVARRRGNHATREVSPRRRYQERGRKTTAAFGARLSEVPLAMPEMCCALYLQAAGYLRQVGAPFLQCCKPCLNREPADERTPFLSPRIAD